MQEERGRGGPKARLSQNTTWRKIGLRASLLPRKEREREGRMHFDICRGVRRFKRRKGGPLVSGLRLLKEKGQLKKASKYSCRDQIRGKDFVLGQKNRTGTVQTEDGALTGGALEGENRRKKKQNHTDSLEQLPKAETWDTGGTEYVKAGPKRKAQEWWTKKVCPRKLTWNCL